MILFHGTSSDRLPTILKEGLRPRKETGAKSNWEGDVESMLDLVYLTTAYPVYFALEACGEGDSKPVILKVDIDEEDLFPDEDFVAKIVETQDRREGKMVLPLKAYNALVNPRDNIDLTQSSLEHNGIVSIERVLPEQIIDHVILELDSRLLWVGGDAAPIPLNYRFKGMEYRRYTEALFEGGLEVAFQLAREDHKKNFGTGQEKPHGTN